MEQSAALTDTRNKAWANDKSKFGYKMLQKMGWKEGKGLGVKEDGTTKHIRVRRKTDNVGVGGETNVDSWSKPAKVAEGLNAVLARLAPVNCAESMVKAKAVEQNGRGYYERRSAGKNVRGYSKKDLKEIFGGITVEPQNEVTKRSHAPKVEEDGDADGIDNMKDEETAEKPDDVDKKDATKSRRNPDERAKRKKIRKEKDKKTKKKSFAVEPAIKKPKKGKKDKKREKR